MIEPVVQLDDFGLTDLQVHWHAPVGDREEITSKFDVGYTVRRLSTDPTKYRLQLTVKDHRSSGKGNRLANVEATIVGFFSFHAGSDEMQREKRIRVNGLTMLYGALRGALATISGIFPPDFRYVLPTVNMLEVIKTVEEARARKAPRPVKGTKVKAPHDRQQKPRAVRATN